ncbi:HPr family phosphocarrier protein [Klebsiella spallanzanii]|uniref:HPr family phosphocarrier protein n=1 Tax=Klebsiella spallanzanii TaxID=2587528 RepID=UPI00111AA89C|nr:HPr family phosphocarrier protein [Klebsiella spallanzanii]
MSYLQAYIRIRNPSGLHARPAAQLVKTVKALDFPVEIAHTRHPERFVNAGSLMKLLSLGVSRADEIIVRLPAGKEVEMFNLQALINAGLGENID